MKNPSKNSGFRTADWALHGMPLAEPMTSKSAIL
jgi:hypothetical protein